MSRVFVIHERQKYNPDTGEFESFRNLSPAALFGELTPVIGVGRPSHDPNVELALIQEKLAEYTPDDYLLLIGDGPFLAMAGAIAARATGGPIRWLVWDRREQRYYASPMVDVYSDEEEDVEP